MMRSTVIFLFLTFSFIFVVSYDTWITKSHISNLVFIMFIPAMIAVIVIKRIDKKPVRSYGLNNCRIRYYVFALMYPYLIIILGLVLVFITSDVKIDTNLNMLREIPGTETIQGNTMILFLFGSNLLFSFLYFLPALGQEFGWRAFLQPKLINKFGVSKGLTLTGVMWGLCNSPMVFLLGQYYPNQHNIVGVGLFIIWSILVGFFLGWLRIKSNSVFPSALCHSAIIVTSGLGFGLTQISNEIHTVPFGYPAFPILLLFAILAYFNIKKTSIETK